MKKKLLAVLLSVIMLLTCFAPVSASAGSDEEFYDIKDMMEFSEGRAWVVLEDGFGVVNEFFELIYKADGNAAAEALKRGDDAAITFEFSPYLNGLAYYQAEGYGYVIVDDEGEEIASAIWTSKQQPKIVARSEESFIVSEYNADDGCNYVYLLNKKGKMKGKKAALGYGDVYFDYMGEGLYTGVAVDEKGGRVRCIYSEDEKKFYVAEDFNQGHFFGVDSWGRGFVFPDNSFTFAYCFDADDLQTEDDYKDWNKTGKAGFQTGPGIMDFYYRTLGEDKFYSGFHKAYINNAGEVEVTIPAFAGMTPVMFGRFIGGSAPIVLQDTDGAFWVTRIDSDGNPCFDPIQVTDPGSEVPTLSDSFANTYTFPEKEEEETAGPLDIFYDGIYLSYEEDDEAVLIDYAGDITEIDHEGLKGAKNWLVYFEDGVTYPEGDSYGDECVETEDTEIADQDWLEQAKLAGTYSGSNGSLLILYADGSAVYQKAGSEVSQKTEFSVEDGVLKLKGKGAPSGDVSDFDGLSFAFGDGETFTRQTTPVTPRNGGSNPGGSGSGGSGDSGSGGSTFDPTGPKVDPNAGGSGDSGSSGGSGGSGSGDSGGSGGSDVPVGPRVYPHRYTGTYYYVEVPEFWWNLEIRQDTYDDVKFYYRGLLLAWLDIMETGDVWLGDIGTYLVMSWPVPGTSKSVVLYTNNYGADIAYEGKICKYQGSTLIQEYTSDADLGDILFRQTGRWIDVGPLKNRIDHNISIGMEDLHDAVILNAINAVTEFLNNNIVPNVTIVPH